MWSFNDGRAIVERKGLKEELPAIAEAYIEHGGGNQYLSERRELLDPLGWEQEATVKFETATLQSGLATRQLGRVQRRGRGRTRERRADASQLASDEDGNRSS
jgi:hypothetical protein